MIIAAFALSVGINAQTMEDVFAEMPDEYIHQLDDAWRKDLISLYKEGKEATLQNVMEGKSTLTKLTDDYISLIVSERSKLEMKLLPLVNDTKLVCMITTVYGPAPDSRVRFFTTEWKPLDQADLLSPVGKEWFIEDSVDKNSINYMEAISLLDMDLFEYTLNPDNLELTEEYSTPKYLGTEEKKKAESILKNSPKKYIWEKSHFK
jgi:hypothetical protein